MYPTNSFNFLPVALADMVDLFKTRIDVYRENQVAFRQPGISIASEVFLCKEPDFVCGLLARRYCWMVRLLVLI